jgi:hypothetical protein
MMIHPGLIFYIHGSLMAFGFLVFISSSIVITRFFRSWVTAWLQRHLVICSKFLLPVELESKQPLWLSLHLTLQLVALLIILTALGILWLFSPNSFCFFGNCTEIPKGLLNDNLFFRQIHRFLGYSVILFVGVFLPILGLPDETDSFKQRMLSLRRHSLLGRFVWFLGILNLLLGLIIIQSPFSLLLLAISFASILLIMIFVLERRFHRKLTKKTQQHQ